MSERATESRDPAASARGDWAPSRALEALLVVLAASSSLSLLWPPAAGPFSSRLTAVLCVWPQKNFVRIRRRARGASAEEGEQGGAMTRDGKER